MGERKGGEVKPGEGGRNTSIQQRLKISSGVGGGRKIIIQDGVSSRSSL